MLDSERDDSQMTNGSAANKREPVEEPEDEMELLGPSGSNNNATCSVTIPPADTDPRSEAPPPSATLRRKETP